MAAEPALVFRDERSYQSYVKALAARQPSSLQQSFELLYITREAEQSALQPVLTLASKPEHIEAEDGIASSVSAIIDRQKKTLSVKTGRFIGKTHYSIESVHTGDHLAQLGRLVKARRSPDYHRIAFWIEDHEAYRTLVIEHLELGLDDLRICALEDESSSASGHLLMADRPSFHLVQKWAEKLGPSSGVRVFYECAKRQMFVEWGFSHPFEAWLPSDGLSPQLVFFHGDGRRRCVATGGLRDIGLVLDFQHEDKDREVWTASSRSPEVPIVLRFSGRALPSDPEMWILPVNRREELEFVIETTPEEELKNLLMAVLTLPDGEEVFVIREVLSGRVPHLLPETDRSYAPLSSKLPNLFLPCDKALSPPLKASRYSEAFKVRSGEITLLEHEGLNIRAFKFEERLFRPMSQLVNFIFSGAAERINEVVLNTPFDIGEFKDIELVDPRAKEQPKQPKQVVQAKAKAEPENASLLGRMKNLVSSWRKKEQPESNDQDDGEDDAKEVLDVERWELEEQLVLRQLGATGWYQLSHYFFRDENPEEGLRCLENGLWLANDDEEGQARQWIREIFADEDGGLGDEQSSLDTVEELYGAIMTLADADGSDAQAITKKTRWLWRQLKRSEGLLRKKSRWLLWRQLLKLNGDAIEEAGQREDLLSELVLKGVEDREVPPFVRSHLLASTRHEGSQSSGGEKALDFLAEAVDIIEKIEEKAQRSLALAQLGYAYVELGDSERGLELAKTAENLTGGRLEEPLDAVCLVRLAALRERAGEPDKQDLFTKTLDFIRDHQGEKTSRFYLRKALERWFLALEDARLSASRSARLIKEGLAVVQQNVPRYRALILKEIAKSLKNMGQTADAIAMARELMTLMPEAFATESSSDDNGREIIQYEDLTTTLGHLMDHDRPERQDAEQVLSVLNSMRAQINEFSIEMALFAFRCPDIDFVSVGDEMADTFAGDGQLYASLNIRLAVLRRLAEMKQRDAGRGRLQAFLEDVRNYKSDHPEAAPDKDYHRLRLLLRLAELIPAFGLGQAGMPLIDQIAQFARSHKNDYVRTNLLSVCATAQAQLGQRAGLMDRIEHYYQFAVKAVEDRRQSTSNKADRTNLMFWVLESCAKSAAIIGETQRGLELVKRIGELSESQIADDWVPTQFWLYCALIRAGQSAQTLGEIKFAEDLAEKTFELIKEKVTFNFDRIDLLEKLVEPVKDLSGAKRFELTGRILEEARTSCKDLGDFGRDFLLKLVGIIAEDIVRGESAYAMALKRWKGDEERLIRDRLSSEQITVFE